jgi:hypothetical protein
MKLKCLQSKDIILAHQDQHADTSDTEIGASLLKLDYSNQLSHCIQYILPTDTEKIVCSPHIQIQIPCTQTSFTLNQRVHVKCITKWKLGFQGCNFQINSKMSDAISI